jgi:hypothetical protein
MIHSRLLPAARSVPLSSACIGSTWMGGGFFLGHGRGRTHERGVVEAVFLFDGAVEEGTESVKVRARGGRGWN